MTTVNTNAAAQTQTQTNTQTTADTGATAAIGEEFMTFIHLLTAQVKNQDPLSPMDSTQFVEQLATFSALEQQVKSNESLGSIATMIGDLHAMLASEWLGQKVAVESSWVPYSGDPIEYSVDKPDGADRAVLTISDAEGEALWSETLDLDEATHTWDGKLQSGEQAALDTLFEFGIEMYSGDTYLGTVAPKVITTVTDVGSENGAMRIGTASHLTSNLDSVEKLAN